MPRSCEDDTRATTGIWELAARETTTVESASPQNSEGSRAAIVATGARDLIGSAAATSVDCRPSFTRAASSLPTLKKARRLGLTGTIAPVRGLLAG